MSTSIKRIRFQDLTNVGSPDHTIDVQVFPQEVQENIQRFANENQDWELAIDGVSDIHSELSTQDQQTVLNVIACFESPFDEDGSCRHCGWNPSYPMSHITYAPATCEYITSHYEVEALEDGDWQYRPLNSGDEWTTVYI